MGPLVTFYISLTSDGVRMMPMAYREVCLACWLGMIRVKQDPNPRVIYALSHSVANRLWVP
jgi:hypothetical protein